MAIPFSTLQYPHLLTAAEEPLAKQDTPVSGTPVQPEGSSRNPYGFFGRPHTHRGAVPRSKRRRYHVSVKITGGKRFF